MTPSDDIMQEAREPNPQMMFMFPIGPWHDWFAWFPVRTYDHRWAWLRSIRRRRLQTHDYLDGPMSCCWQYHRENLGGSNG